MLIVCPNCSTSYAVEAGLAGRGGRTVRCARCKITWFANGEQAVPEMATAEAASEAEEAFRGVIRPDHRANTAGKQPIRRLPRPITPPQRPNRAKRRLPPRFRSHSMHLRSCRPSSRLHIRTPHLNQMKSKLCRPAQAATGPAQAGPPLVALDGAHSGAVRFQCCAGWSS